MPSLLTVFGPLFAMAALILITGLWVMNFELNRDKRAVVREVRRRGGKVQGLRWSSQHFLGSLAFVQRDSESVFEVTYRDQDGQLRQATCRPSYARYAAETATDEGKLFWSDDHALQDGRSASGGGSSNGSAGDTGVSGRASGGEDGGLAQRVQSLRAANARLRRQLEQAGRR